MVLRAIVLIVTLSLGLLAALLAVWPVVSSAQGTDWERHMEAGRAANQQGRYVEAEKSFQAALNEIEKSGPPDRLALTLLYLGRFYREQGRYAEAEPLLKRALAIWEKRRLAHPHMTTSLKNLVLIYDAEGRYDEAGSLYKRVIAIFEKRLGPDHPEVATTLENYAALLRKTNRAAEAAELEARARAIRAKYSHEKQSR